MTDWLIAGKKGSGKSLVAVARMRDALLQGRRVATNLNLDLQYLLPARNKQHVIRVPDKPEIADFEALGRGQEGINEENNGVLVLDECAAWLNARAYQDKSRQPMLDWLIHSRKLGWDVYFIAQGQGQIDKQVRDTQIEMAVYCKRLDRLKIPLLTWLTQQFFGERHALRFPKVHIGIVKHGMAHDAMMVDRWYYRARDLYKAYDTQQIFLPAGHPDAVGLHCMLSAWHVYGRYRKPRPSLRQLLVVIPKLPLYGLAALSIRLGWMTREQAFSRT